MSRWEFWAAVSAAALLQFFVPVMFALLVLLVLVLAVVGVRRRLAFRRKRAAVLAALREAQAPAVDPQWEARTRKALLSTATTVRISAQRDPS